MRDTRSDTESEITDSEKEEGGGEEDDEKGGGGGRENKGGEAIEDLGDKKELEDNGKLGLEVKTDNSETGVEKYSGEKEKELEEDRNSEVEAKSEGVRKLRDKVEIGVERCPEEREDEAEEEEEGKREVGEGGERAAVGWGEKSKIIDSGEELEVDEEIGTDFIEDLENATTRKVVKGDGKKDMNEVVEDQVTDKVEEEEGEEERGAARRRRGEEKEEKTEKQATQ